MSAAPASPWLRLAGACLLFAATATLYAPARDLGFVNYDDDFLVTGSPALALGLSRDGVAWALRDGSHGNWFPLTRLSYLLDQDLHGLSPAGVHLGNVALHAASAALLFLALVRMTGALGASAFAAALWSAHPLAVESVAWAAERKGVLAGLFWMLALRAYAGVGAGPLGWRRGAAVAACLAGALMAKPVAVTLPAVLLLLDAWPLRRLAAGGVGWRRALAEKAPLVALVAASAVVTVLAQGGAGATVSIEQLPLGQRLANAAVSYLAYLRRFAWPEGLAVFYPHPEGSLSLATVAGAVVALGAATAFVAWQWRRRPWLAVGWLWFGGVLVPMIGIVQVGSQANADRYAYLPIVGLAIAVAWTGAEAAARWRAARAPLAIGALLVVAALAVTTRAQLRHWRDSEALFRHALAVTERNPIAHAQLGLALLAAGRSEEAVVELRTAVALRPDFLEIANNLAWLLATHPDPAVRDPEEAARIARAAGKQAAGQSPIVLDTLAAAHAAAGRYDRAGWYATRAVQLAVALGDEALAEEIRARLAGYREGRPYVEEPVLPPVRTPEDAGVRRPATPAR